MRRALLFMLVLALAACALPQIDEREGFDPLLIAPEDSEARAVVIAIPGALTSIKVMLPIEQWRTPERTIAYYRLPGFDARPATDAFSIDAAASRIATFVRDRGFEEVYMLGHSTGAAIALEAAKAIRRVRPRTEVHVVGVSTALPAPQPVLAGVRGVQGSLAAAWRAKTLRPRDVWIEYYRRISYGPDVSYHLRPDPGQAPVVVATEAEIQLPAPGLGRKHFTAILGWQNPGAERLQGTDMAFWAGAVDPVFPPRAVRRFVGSLPEARLRFVPHHGHVLLLTYPEIWGEIRAHWGF